MTKSTYIGGTFDCFHDGHKELLDVAMSICNNDTLYIIVNSDEFVKNHKNINLVDDFNKRAQNTYEYCVGKVEHLIMGKIGTDDEHVEYLDSIKPTYMIHGDDWDGKRICERYMVDYPWLKERNIILIFTPRTTGQSSTEIRKQRQPDAARLPI